MAVHDNETWVTAPGAQQDLILANLTNTVSRNRTGHLRQNRHIHFPLLKYTNIHLRGAGDMIRLEIITVATLATVNAVITFMAAVVASTVSGFMVFIQAHITEDLDDCTTIQPLMV